MDTQLPAVNLVPTWSRAISFGFPYTAPSNGFAWTLSTSWPRDGVFSYTVNGKSVGGVYTPNRSNVQMSAVLIPLKKGDILSQSDSLGYNTLIFIPI